MPLKWLFERITIITSIVYLSLIMHQGLGQMFYIHYFFSIFQITLQGDTILICAVSEAEGGGLESPGWDGVPAASLWLWEMGLEIPRSCFSNLLFTVDKSENQPGGFIVWPRDKVKRKLKILEVQFLAQESVHISMVLMIPPAILARRENDPRNTHQHDTRAGSPVVCQIGVLYS